MIKAGEMIISGFVSKIISDIVDIPEKPIKDAIRNADKKKRDKNQTIETRIYQVTIDAIKEFTKREYKGRDVLYDAAESMIIGFKNSNNNVEAVRAGLKMLVSQVTSETCEEFLKTLCYVICIDKSDILYKQITLIQGEQTFETVREGFEVSNKNDEETHEKLDYVIEGIDNITEKISGTENDVTMHYKVPVKNRADEYAEKWDKNVFLNDFNEEDETAGINIKLREIYVEECLPHYIWRNNTKSSDKLRNLLTKYIISNNGRKLLLILGQAGIGKSTLITWIMANLVQRKDQVFVYQFTSDLKAVNWQGDNTLSKIFSISNCNDWKNRVLILDGFDEIHVDGDREKILNKLNQEVKGMRDLENFSLLITCRENYVHELERIECDYKILENKEIFGMPLILYMVLALNISIEKNRSIVDIYDQIFSLDRGSIYDRCVKSSRYAKEHRISEPKIKQQIHQVSQRIAFWIFENNSDKAFIYQKKFKEICDTVMDREEEDIQRDVLIGSYFELIRHCEGVKTNELHFIHRSIYEYFVAVYFFESVYALQSKEEIAGKLGELLKKGYLSNQILEFIEYKFDGSQETNLPSSIKEIFQIMLQKGMTYYTKERCRNIVDGERTIFSNMLKVVGIWNMTFGEINARIATYLQCNREDGLNLRGIILKDINPEVTYLSKIDLRGANLIGFDLTGADLNEANLSNANLKGASLNEADLSRTDLNEANLSSACLIGADLYGADISRADLRGINLSKANLSKTYLSGADLANANLDRANLKRANLKRTYLNGASIREADMSEADMSGANLSGANLRGTIFSRAHLCETDISGANLREANLKEANLRETNLREANLNEADLRRVNLNKANLNRAYLKKANLSEANLSEVNLSGANLKNTIFDEQQVDLLHKKYNLSYSNVYFPKSGKIISYKEYCIKKQQE